MILYERLRDSKTFMTKKDVHLFLLVSILALFVRLGYLLFIKQYYPFYDNPSSDVVYYQQWADELARGQTVSAGRPQGLLLYPLALALLKRLTLNTPWLIRLGHVLLGSLNCGLVFLLGNTVFSRRVALLAALLAVVNPTLVYYDWLMMPVSLIIGLSLLLLLAFTHREMIVHKREWFGVGLLAGLLILGDGKGLIFILLMIPVLLVNRTPGRGLGRFPLGPLLLGMGTVLLGVALYYHMTTGDGVFISSKSGFSFYAGNNSRAEGFYTHPLSLRANHRGQDEDQRLIAEQAMKRPLSFSDVSRYWFGRAFKYIRLHPGDYVRLLGRKGRLFMTDTEKSHDLDLLLQLRWLTRMDVNPFAVMFPLALWGIFIGWPERRKTLPLLLLLASQWLFTLIFYLTTRHRTTVIPVLLIFEGAALDWLAFRIHRRDLKSAGAVAAAVFLFLVLVPPQAEDPRYVEYLFAVKSGQNAELKGQYRQAQRYYHEAVFLNPRSADAWFSLGNAYILAEDYSRAQASYIEALKLNPVHTDALYNLGYAYEKSGQLDLAHNSYSALLQRDPGSADVHYRLAEVLGRQGACGQALEHMGFVLTRYPGKRGAFQPLRELCGEPGSPGEE